MTSSFYPQHPPPFGGRCDGQIDRCGHTNPPKSRGGEGDLRKGKEGGGPEEAAAEGREAGAEDHAEVHVLGGCRSQDFPVQYPEGAGGGGGGGGKKPVAKKAIGKTI